MGHWFRRQRSMDARDGEDAYRRRYAKKEPGPKTGPGGSVCRRGGRHHLPEGNMLMRSATLGGQRRRISVAGICSGDSDAATDTSACQPCTAGSVAGHDKFHEWCGSISILGEEIDPVGKPTAALQVPIHHVDCVTGKTREK